MNEPIIAESRMNSGVMMIEPSMRESHPLAVAGRVALFLLLGMVVFATASGVVAKGGSHDLKSSALAVLGTYALTVLFVRWDGLQLKDVGAAFGLRSVPRFVAGFAIGAAMVGVQVAALTASGRLHWERTDGGYATIASGFGLFLLVGLREELAFRGYPLRCLEARWGAWVAQIAVALVFAAEHGAAGYTWTNMVFGVFVGSLLFGTAALVTRGLAVPVGIHVAWNFGTWMTGSKSLPGMWRVVADPDFAAGAEWLKLASYVVTAFLAMAALWWMGRRGAFSH